MSEVKVLEMSEAPEENSGKLVEFVHPYTSFPYTLGVFHVKERYFAITDDCKACGNSLGKGKLNGMYVSCIMEEHPWNVKTGICKFNRTLVTPTYRVSVKEDGLYIEI
jgi:nitrite reductase/ring-hydroxylating ferredoxin subunit